MEARFVPWVALGGALGAVARLLVSAALTRAAFPYGTLAVNVVGSFALGLLLFSRGGLDPTARAFFGIGVLGAFTTMSTFSYETLLLWSSGHTVRAVLNVALNVILSLAAVALGRAIAS